MNSRSPSTSRTTAKDDLTLSYAARVGGLHGKLSRIAANQREIAQSLGRAVIALRSLAAS